MVFTSPSAANKGNRFHILAPRAIIEVIIEECVVFNILEPVLMVIPAMSSQPETCMKVATHERFREYTPLSIQVIDVDRVLESVYRTAENSLSTFVFTLPREIISCETKNISVINRLIPGFYGGQALALVIYNYEVEVTYLDSTGHFRKVSIFSGSRHEQAFVRTAAAGYLDSSVKAYCIYSDFSKLRALSIKPSPDLTGKVTTLDF